MSNQRIEQADLFLPVFQEKEGIEEMFNGVSLY